ncbi:hypothetical protein MtrunA17_Chr3g0124901 [Medicago truncatula]|uniref:Uncharacterized protein n=1 Tax=Medicago truncatula TaxID=3880 RepID=A0A396IVK6_MEDTR|nr:hypothetical protein MtrunA17_Chr3g0124901 [Medicago truncatula]
MIKGSESEVRSQTQTSLGRRNKSMYQIQHFSVVSKDILQVRFLVFCLKPLCPFVPHDHWTSTSNNIRHFPQLTEKPKTIV